MFNKELFLSLSKSIDKYLKIKNLRVKLKKILEKTTVKFKWFVSITNNVLPEKNC